MEKTSAKIKRPLWVASLNIALALTVGSTQSFAVDINSVADLLAVSGNEGYVLTRSLDLSTEDADESALGTQLADVVTEGISTYIPNYVDSVFTGTFDGRGFTISGLTKPLFNDLSGDVSNLNLASVAGIDIGLGTLGALARILYPGSTIDNVSFVGTVTGNGDYVGGLVGSSGGTITNSSATGTVTGNGDYVGGLAGYSNGTITNSYASGNVTGSNSVGGLVGQGPGAITNSYAAGNVAGVYEVGGLVGYQHGDIANSYASGNVTGYSYVGGLVGSSWGADVMSVGITRSYAAGDVIGYRVVGGLVGDNYVDIDTFSYGAGEVTGTGGGYIQPSSGLPPLSATELLAILNTGYDDPVFAIDSNINEGRPHLISHLPPNEDNGDEQVSPRFNFQFLPTQVLDSLKKSVGFTVAKSDLNKLDLALLDQVKDDKSAQIIGGKLFSYQSLSTSLSAGSIFQLEINFEANKSLQVWVKSSDDQYVLLGDVSFDKDGNAVLPGIEFKKSGQYEIIFVNSDKKDLTQPELVNKVSGLTVYVN
jgi:hypothetical protein